MNNGGGGRGEGGGWTQGDDIRSPAACGMPYNNNKLYYYTLACIALMYCRICRWKI